MQAVQPPTPFDAPPGKRVVFLAGSIEMGLAEDWQTQLIGELADLDGLALNPRRDDWDASWTQSIDDAQFRGQVTWELDGLDRADVIAMWFAPSTKAPITLLELGLHAHGGKLVVGCPSGFWRRGNIEIVCARFAIPLVATWPEFVTAIRVRA